MTLLAPPENFASKLLTYFDYRVSATPLEEIAEALGLDIRDSTTPAFEGMLMRAPFAAGGVIVIGAGSSNMRRKRFTIAHEIGHYCLEKKNSVCVAADFQLWDMSAPKERNANRFAAELLLPAKKVGRLINQCGVSIEAAKFIRDCFNVSLTTAAFRCAELASEECALVYTVDGIVKSYVPSKSWRYRIVTKCPLSKNSKAGKLLEDPTIRQQSGRVSALVWADGSKFMDLGAEVLENSIHLPSYKTILSFLIAL